MEEGRSANQFAPAEPDRGKLLSARDLAIDDLADVGFRTPKDCGDFLDRQNFFVFGHSESSISRPVFLAPVVSLGDGFDLCLLIRHYSADVCLPLRELKRLLRILGRDHGQQFDLPSDRYSVELHVNSTFLLFEDDVS
jgi:hypothetical protein